MIDRERQREITPAALPCAAGPKPAAPARRWGRFLGQVAVGLMLSTGSQAAPQPVGAGDGLPGALRACPADRAADDDALMMSAIKDFRIDKQNRRTAKRTLAEIVLSYPDGGTRRRLYEIYLRCLAGILEPPGPPDQAPEEKIAEQRRRLAETEEFVADTAGRHGIEAWDEARATMLAQAASGPGPSKDGNARFFRFLRDAAAAYDGYARDLLSCWKRRRCHRDMMRSYCSTFEMLLEQMRQIEEAASRDPMSAATNSIIGEEEHQDYFSLQAPGVASYITWICPKRRY
jgi:hypothetical protein